jgi:plastocyanin
MRRALVPVVGIVLAGAPALLSFVWFSTADAMYRHPPTQSPHDIRVSANGSFSPSVLEGIVGDTVNWVSLDEDDSVVPYLSDVIADPCDAANKVTYDPDSLQGPTRLGVPGIFIRGPDPDNDGYLDKGPEIVLLATPCDNDANPAEGPTRKVCDEQDGVPKYLPDEVWAYPGISGELMLMAWKEIETCAGDGDPTNPCYDFTQLGHELDNAVDNGKHLMLSVKTGLGSAPESWLFTTGGVTEVVLKGTNADSENDFSATNCGTDFSMGSFADPDYVTRLDLLIEALGAYVKSDAAWVQAFAGVQLMGVHIATGEFQVVTTAPDSYLNACGKGGFAGAAGTCALGCASAGNGHSVACSDGVLDSYTGDDCVHNTAAWAASGWTSTGLTNFVDNQVDKWHEEFWDELIVRFALKQGGLPGIASSTQYANDDLRDQTGALICAGCTVGDAGIPSSASQVDNIIQRGLSQHPDTQWNMHLGVDPLPIEHDNPASDNCSFAGTPDFLQDPPVITFPIPLIGPVGTQDNCPNKWANNTTITPPRVYMTGFQTNNVSSGGIDTPRDLESALMNIEQNTNAVELDVYLHPVFINHEVNGNGDMNSERDTYPDACPAGYEQTMCYSKSIREHRAELVARRESTTFAHRGKVFPTVHSYTFTAPGTYRFYNPRTCAQGVGKAGVVIIE